jgi:MFS transporter, ACS family, glucarate transporter
MKTAVFCALQILKKPKIRKHDGYVIPVHDLMNNCLKKLHIPVPVRAILVFLTFLHSVNLYIDRAAISVARDSVVSDLGLTDIQFGWVMAMFTLGYALFQSPSGYIADKRGPRFVLTAIIIFWSACTKLTAAAWNYTSLLVNRFLFGAGEAGAFPALSKVVYNWFPLKERGIVQGINFSGSRIGAAFTLPLVALLIANIGWRLSFVVIGALGILYAIFWYIVFRDTPEESGWVSEEEKEFIIKTRQQPTVGELPAFSISRMFLSGNMWLAMGQYICSNFTFYFTLTWMLPYITDRFQMDIVQAGFYSMFPLLAGAVGNWFSGWLVDFIYKKKQSLKISRRVPAMIGFLLASSGMVMVTVVESPVVAVFFMSVAIFGADMTLSPSWSFCIDIAKERAGVVSGTMNMAGNLGAFVTIITYPYLFAATGSHVPFFYICAVLSLSAIIMWLFMNPDKALFNHDK